MTCLRPREEVGPVAREDCFHRSSSLSSPPRLSSHFWKPAGPCPTGLMLPQTSLVLLCWFCSGVEGGAAASTDILHHCPASSPGCL